MTGLAGSFKTSDRRVGDNAPRCWPGVESIGFDHVGRMKNEVQRWPAHWPGVRCPASRREDHSARRRELRAAELSSEMMTQPTTDERPLKYSDGIAAALTLNAIKANAAALQRRLPEGWELGAHTVRR